MWQDYVIAVVVLMFTLTTIPMILAGTKVPVWTSLPMFVGSCLLAITYVSIDLWFSVSVELIAVGAWAILFRNSVRT